MLETKEFFLEKTAATGLNGWNDRKQLKMFDNGWKGWEQLNLVWKAENGWKRLKMVENCWKRLKTDLKKKDAWRRI